ncbi:MAG TPA: hypothetical protein VG713_01895 [Pirellulales bacterium]|nr:hypothetical protein [Pirellulales bacterium]
MPAPASASGVFLAADIGGANQVDRRYTGQSGQRGNHASARRRAGLAQRDHRTEIERVTGDTRPKPGRTPALAKEAHAGSDLAQAEHPQQPRMLGNADRPRQGARHRDLGGDLG